MRRERMKREGERRIITITPKVLTDAMVAGGDVAKRAFAAMMPMQKIDVATIEAAVRGVAV